MPTHTGTKSKGETMIPARCDDLPPEALEELFSSLASWIASSGLLLLMLNAAMRQPIVANRVAAALRSLETVRAQLDALIASAHTREDCDAIDPPDGAHFQ
jgi:hypothetical protein